MQQEKTALIRIRNAIQSIARGDIPTDIEMETMQEGFEPVLLKILAEDRRKQLAPLTTGQFPLISTGVVLFVWLRGIDLCIAVLV